LHCHTFKEISIQAAIVAFLRHNLVMHILIPFAALPEPAFQTAFNSMQLPHLHALLNTLTLHATHEGQADALTPLHERLALQLQGLHCTDGLTGAAERAAQQSGLLQTDADPQSGWAFMTLCHWEIQTQQVFMHDPNGLHITTTEADTLLKTMQPYFAGDGIRLYPYQNGTWLAQGPHLFALPTASLSRVNNQRVDEWMPRQPQAKAVLRLQNEMQMLLYTHPINDARSVRGAPIINSFWVHGTGDAGTEQPKTLITASELSHAAMQNNPSAWCQAWQALDSTLLHQAAEKLQQGEAVELTLCGLERALHYTHQPVNWWQRCQRSWRRTPPQRHLQSLFTF
jgi:hypothetical protein